MPRLVLWRTVMNVVTTLIAPPLLKFAFRGEVPVPVEEMVPHLG